MNIPVRLILLSIALLAGAVTAGAQCTADAGPDQALSCLAPSVTLQGSSNIPGAAFSWSSPSGFTSNSQNPVVNLSGTYTLTITDPSDGCTATDAVVVAPAGPLITVSFVDDVSCFDGTDGSIDITVTGGVSPYSYLWASGVTVQDIMNLTAGTYTVTVADDTGCTKTAEATVGQPTQLTISFVTNNVSCSGGTNGSINMTVTGGTPAYNFLWNNGATVEDLSGLPAGTYTVTVMDNHGCTKASTTTLTQTTPVAVSAITTNVSCFGGSNGAIDLTVTGGAPPYTYLWVNGSTLQDLPGLAAGTYTVTVTDVNGCTKTNSATVTQPPVIALSLTQNNVSCFGGANGWIDLTVTGGTPGYTYAWSTGVTTQDMTNLPPNPYTVTVTDVNGCTKTSSTTITQPPALAVSAVPFNASCVGGPGGGIDVSVTGGSPGYTYTWSTGSTTQDLLNLGVGLYTVTVTDSNGCTRTGSATVTTFTVSISASATNVSCFGGMNGSILITTPNFPQGSPGYTFQWSNGSTTQNLSGLAAGIYTVTATDDNGCTNTTSATITEPAVPFTVSVLANNVLCIGDANGSIDLSVITGTAPFSYNWSNGFVSGSGTFPSSPQALSSLPAGDYIVTVTDANGCTKTGTATISEPAPLDLNADIAEPSCGGADGGIDLSVTGGTPAYQYVWSNGSNTEDINNLAAGTYAVTVIDANNCSKAASFVVNQIDISGVIHHIPCGGIPNEATITLSVSGGTPTYTYDWSDLPGAPDPGDRNSVTVGTYTVTVSDSGGCSNSASFTVQEGIIISAEASHPACAGVPDGSIVISHTVGTGPFQYDWADLPGAGDPQNRSGLPAGTYLLTVTDANFCTGTASVTLVYENTLAISTVVTLPSCFGDTDGSIDVTVSGSGLFAYSWSRDGQSLAFSGEDFIPLTQQGTYQVIVTNSMGCTASTSTVITLPAAISIQLVASTPVTCFGGNDGALAAGASGGTPPYTYHWAGPNGFTSTGQIISGLPAGTYIVTVTDAHGCTGVLPGMSILQPQELVLTPPVFCDWEVGVQASGGSLPFQFVWSNGATDSVTILPPGNYSITVTDAQGCTSIQDVFVPAIPLPCTKITGKVKFELIEDCVAEDSETGLGGWFVRAVGADTYYGYTDPAGGYEVRVAPGDYAVSLVPPANTPVFICQDEIDVSLPLNGDEATADFAVQDLPGCPAMTVDLTAPVLRRCLNNNYYYVHYCNTGPVEATDAYVDLQLDPNISVLSAPIPYNDLGNNLYRFNLGTVAAFDCNNFSIQVYVSCTAVLGQTLCSEAHIYPDTLCVPFNPLWTGARVELNAACNPDSLRFVLKNTGFGPMTNILNYIVIEDGIIGWQGMAPPLPPGDSMEIAVPANGSTWRLEASQDTFFPGQSVPVLSVEGCTDNASFSTGFVSQFKVNDDDPWVDLECTVVTGSYDPNDKQGFPTGYGAGHYIKPGTEIEYLIRFQNTGTDTAFHVMVLDTLSAWLDLVTIRPGASSHPYELSFTGPDVLAFDFKNIFLPDSNHNEAASHGFVKFRIAPRSDAPLESDIFNGAAIYFDFNDPVITNTTVHRIGEKFILVSAWYPQVPEYQVQIAPNPFQSHTWITLSGAPPNDRYTLSLYNLTGNLVKTIAHDHSRFRLERDGLSRGVYMFKIERNGAPAGWGKIVVGD